MNLHFSTEAWGPCCTLLDLPDQPLQSGTGVGTCHMSSACPTVPLRKEGFALHFTEAETETQETCSVVSNQHSSQWWGLRRPGQQSCSLFLYRTDEGTLETLRCLSPVQTYTNRLLWRVGPATHSEQLPRSFQRSQGLLTFAPHAPSASQAWPGPLGMDPQRQTHLFPNAAFKEMRARP